MKTTVLILFAAFISAVSFSQLKAEDVQLSFYSKMDDITAKNTTVSSTLNLNTGELTFEVKIDAFEFVNKTMQKHFNEDGVMNSVEFPVASFKGKISNNDEVDYTANGTYDVQVKGIMTIKGVSKEFSAKGQITVEGSVITATSAFELDRFEYGVKAKENSVSQILAIKVKGNYK